MALDLKTLMANRWFYLLALAIAYLIIAIIFMWPMVSQITTYTLGGGGDIYQAMWNLWWVPYALFTLHTSPYFSSLIYYPVGANLVTETMAPIAGLVSWPFQAVNIGFALNIITLLGFTLSGVFAYLLAEHITKNKYASFIAGFIFAFSPWHMDQALGHMQFANIEFIPLFVLVFMLLFETKKIKYMFYSSIAFLLATFMGDLEQGILLGMLAIVILAYYLVMHRKDVLNKRVLPMLGGIVIVTLLPGAPAFIPMIQAVQNGVLSSVNAQATTDYNVLYSADLEAYFLPSYLNGIFHGASNSYSAIFAADPGERAVYAGYTVMALCAVAVYFFIKEKKLKANALWIFVLFFFGWFTFGPYLQVGGTVTSVPGIYQLFHDIPVLNVLREPARFDLIVTLALSVLAALGFAKLMQHEKLTRQQKQYAFVVVLVLLLIEYWGFIGLGSYTSNVISPVAIPQAYTQLAQQPGNFTLLVLPILQANTASPLLYPGLAMYYQTAFKKPMVGGDAARTNDTQDIESSAIPITDQASYLQSGYGLIYPYPIVENFTNDTLFWLLRFNVSYIAVQRSAFNLTEQVQLLGYLQGVFGKPVYQDNTTTVFTAVNAVDTRAGRSIIAYTAGTWLPGVAFCQTGYACNTTLASFWWGASTRAIEIYSPTAQRANVSFYSYAAVKGPLYTYLNGARSGQANLTETPAYYTEAMNLSQGVNLLLFIGGNYTQYTGSPYLNYGIYNLTVR